MLSVRNLVAPQTIIYRLLPIRADDCIKSIVVPSLRQDAQEPLEGQQKLSREAELSSAPLLFRAGEDAACIDLN